MASGNRQNVFGQLRGFWPLHVLTDHIKIQKLMMKKHCQNSVDISMQIVHSYYVCHNLGIFQSYSRKYYYNFADFRISNIACVENKLFVYLPLTFQK